MCGITGCFWFERGRPADPEQLAQMNATLAHRGPDDHGQIVVGPVGLAMRRLNVIDLVSGHQPMSTEDDSVHIVFNGEIYNFLLLRQELEQRGHRFITHADTEVLLHAYMEYGTDCVRHLRGMFAFAIWDERNHTLMLARDRLGKKPLYYQQNAQGIIFGSELKALLASGTVEREIDYEALNDYLTYQYVPSPRTIFRGVSKLPAAHWLTIDASGRNELHRYWEPAYPDPSAVESSEEEYTERVRACLEESVNLRTISDVPLGAFLSGGVDSSLVVAMMARASNRPVQTFSIGFDEPSHDESAYARQVADHLGTEHHEQIVHPDAFDVLPALVRSFDEPFADHSAIPMYYLSRSAREHVTVCLTGDGGDEVFGGYNSYVNGLRRHRSDALPGWIRSLVLQPAFRLAPSGFSLKEPLFHLGADTVRRHGWNLSSGGFSWADKPSLLSTDVRRQITSADASYDLLGAAAREVASSDTLTTLQHMDLMTYLPEDILVKVDRMTMAHSLEGRSPLLDHELVELLASIPSSFKIRGGETKYLLKKIAQEFLPDSIINRPKKGFSAPLSSWFRGDSKGRIHDILFDGRLEQRGFFQTGFIRDLVAAQERGVDTSRQIWSLVFFEEWCKEYLDQPSTPKGSAA
jgi:asparagine synthase (glutamine-hydrolysing)